MSDDNAAPKKRPYEPPRLISLSPDGFSAEGEVNNVCSTGNLVIPFFQACTNGPSPEGTCLSGSGVVSGRCGNGQAPDLGCVSGGVASTRRCSSGSVAAF